MVLAMRHGMLPKTLHVDAPSSKVDWTAGAVRLLTEETAWPDHGTLRRAGVSSFGGSGTNAHGILAPPPNLESAMDSRTGDRDTAGHDAGLPALVPVIVSARSASGLAAQADRVASFLDTGSDDFVGVAGAGG